MNNNEEFSSLRDEIIESITLQNNYIVAMYTIAVTIMVFAIEKNNSVLFLMPYMILFPFQSIINSKRDGMLKMGAYIEVYYGQDFKWEHTNYLITDAMNQKRNRKRC